MLVTVAQLCSFLTLAQAPAVLWDPARLSVEIIPGTTIALSVHLTSAGDRWVEVRPDASLMSFCVAPPPLELTPLEPTIVPLVFAVPADQPLEALEGSVRVLRYFLRGDSNGDAAIDIADPILTLFALFASTPLFCPDAADADDSGTLSISDPIIVLIYLFQNGVPPAPPFPQLGVDVQPDELPCEAGPVLPVTLSVAYPTPDDIQNFSAPIEERLVYDPGVLAEIVAEELLLLFPFDATAPEAADTAAAAGGFLTGGDPALAVYQARFPGVLLDGLPAVITQLEAHNPRCRPLHNLQIATLTRTDTAPNDPEYSSGNYPSPTTPWWSHDMIRTLPSWGVTCGDPAVTIAIVDTGFAPTHPDLIENVFEPEKVIRRLGPESHGTSVAGIAAAKGNNGLGITGVCWNCKLHMRESGYDVPKVEFWGALVVYRTKVYEPWIIQNMRQAVDAGADVINVSIATQSPLGTTVCDLPTTTRERYEQFWACPIEYAKTEFPKKNNEQLSQTVFVFAAGNGSRDIGTGCVLPAAFSSRYPDRAITVASVNHARTISFRADCIDSCPGSNWGSAVTVAAPGTNILTTIPLTCTGSDEDRICHEYGLTFGTSMAAPFVSGLVGLLRSLEPTISTADVVKRITDGARFGGKKVPENCFYIIDALQTLQPNPPPDPPPSPGVVTWKVWPSVNPVITCTGPVGAQGHSWYDPAFDDCFFDPVPIPHDDNASRTDRFYRGIFLNAPDTAARLSFASDDGLTLYVNGTYYDHWGGACHGSGCVNLNSCRTSGGNSTDVPPQDITYYLQPGLNTIAAHVSNRGCCDMYFTAALSLLPQDPQPSGGFALQFDGSNDYVEVEHSASLNLTTWTIQCWFLAHSDQQAELLFRSPGGINGQINYRINFGYDRFGTRLPRVLTLWYETSTDADFYVRATSPSSLNAWHHVTGIYDGSTLHLYLDGVLNTSRDLTNDASRTPNTGFAPLQIGWGQAGRFHGLIDEVRIWNRALPKEQIEQNWNTQITDLTQAKEAGLVAYYNFEETVGQMVIDRSNTGNIGTLGPTDTAEDTDPKWTAGIDLPSGP